RAGGNHAWATDPGGSRAPPPAGKAGPPRHPLADQLSSDRDGGDVQGSGPPVVEHTANQELEQVRIPQRNRVMELVPEAGLLSHEREDPELVENEIGCVELEEAHR